MPRPRQQSIIQVPPRVRGFNPAGCYTSESSTVQLNLEEFEVIRLLDYEDLSQQEASAFMKVSRPTLTRIYDRARKKIACALTESNRLLIEGGEARFEGEWYTCEGCGNTFNNPGKEKVACCPLCLGKVLSPIN